MRLDAAAATTERSTSVSESRYTMRDSAIDEVDEAMSKGVALETAPGKVESELTIIAL